MNDLLVGALDAHGGVDRWARVHTITAHLSIGGRFWGRKGWPHAGISPSPRTTLPEEVITCTY